MGVRVGGGYCWNLVLEARDVANHPPEFPLELEMRRGGSVS